MWRRATKEGTSTSVERNLELEWNNGRREREEEKVERGCSDILRPLVERRGCKGGGCWEERGEPVSRRQRRGEARGQGLMNSLHGNARCGCRLSRPRCRYTEEEEINWGWKTRLREKEGKGKWRCFPSETRLLLCLSDQMRRNK